MRIRTQFIITMLLFGLLLVIMAASAVITNQRLEKAGQNERIAAAIAQGASELGYLTNEYLIYREDQQMKRWHSRFGSLSAEVVGLRADRIEQQALFASIQANLKRLKEVFDSVASGPEFSPGTIGVTLVPVSLQVSWSRMAVQGQGLVSDASRLSWMLHKQMDQIISTRTLLMNLTVVLFGLFLLASYRLTYRRMLKSIAVLRAGTAVIGTGDLEFAVEEKKNDEIGDLSRDFNRMVTELKAVTASKADLEREIAERKRAEHALRQSEQRWATTLASIGDAVIATDIDGRVSFMNAVAEGLTGWTIREALQRPVESVFHIINEYSRLEADNPVTKALRQGTVVGLANHTLLVKKDGDEVPIDDSAAPIRDADGRIMGVVLVFRDITERNLAEKALKKSEAKYRSLFTDIKKAQEDLGKARDELEQRVHERTAELERRNQELQNFTFAASHDLQEPLRKIQTFSDLIASKYAASLSEQGRDYLRRMNETATRMRDVLQSLQNYSRLTFKPEPFVRVDLNEVGREVISDFELQIRHTGALVEIGKLPEIEADAAQMRQLLQNLVENALKFRRKGELLNVKIYAECKTCVEPVNGQCKIYVNDNGIGFDENYLDRIFSPFQRLHAKDEYEGIGMGLAICKKIVEHHKGTITARSTPGRGSTFIITLPVRG